MTPGASARAVSCTQSQDASLPDLPGEDILRLVSAAADVVLMLDDHGVICDMVVASEDMKHSGCQSWVGQAWSQTVTVESLPKVEGLLTADHSQPINEVRWRQVNHVLGDGTDIPVAYTVARLPGSARTHALAFGRDLRPNMVLQQRLVNAQLSLEQDYWRLRQVETRYRLLFQMAPEPVLIFADGLERLDEANAAAHALLGDALRQPGWTLLHSLQTESKSRALAMLERMRASGHSEPCPVQLHGKDDTWLLSVIAFRQDQKELYLARLGSTQTPPSQTTRTDLSLQHVLQALPDAMVVTDANGRIQYCNRAFLDLGQIAHEAQTQGQGLERWLGRSGVDVRVLLTNLRQHGSIRLFSTQLRGEFGSVTDVEVSAATLSDGGSLRVAFTIRDIGRRLHAGHDKDTALPRSTTQMTELVGRLPLKDIVRETTDLIEQRCIQAALELTGDNRASAAEILGLSRQSLYIKLRRHGLMAAEDVDGVDIR